MGTTISFFSNDVGGLASFSTNSQLTFTESYGWAPTNTKSFAIAATISQTELGKGTDIQPVLRYPLATSSTEISCSKIPFSQTQFTSTISCPVANVAIPTGTATMYFVLLSTTASGSSSRSWFDNTFAFSIASTATQTVTADAFSTSTITVTSPASMQTITTYTSTKTSYTYSFPDGGTTTRTVTTPCPLSTSSTSTSSGIISTTTSTSTIVVKPPIVSTSTEVILTTATITGSCPSASCAALPACTESGSSCACSVVTKCPANGKRQELLHEGGSIIATMSKNNQMRILQPTPDFTLGGTEQRPAYTTTTAHVTIVVPEPTPKVYTDVSCDVLVPAYSCCSDIDCPDRHQAAPRTQLVPIPELVGHVKSAEDELNSAIGHYSSAHHLALSAVLNPSFTPFEAAISKAYAHEAAIHSHLDAEETHVMAALGMMRPEPRFGRPAMSTKAVPTPTEAVGDEELARRQTPGAPTVTVTSLPADAMEHLSKAGVHHVSAMSHYSWAQYGSLLADVSPFASKFHMSNANEHLVLYTSHMLAQSSHASIAQGDLGLGPHPSIGSVIVKKPKFLIDRPDNTKYWMHPTEHPPVSKRHLGSEPQSVSTTTVQAATTLTSKTTLSHAPRQDLWGTKSISWRSSTGTITSQSYDPSHVSSAQAHLSSASAHISSYKACTSSAQSCIVHNEPPPPCLSSTKAQVSSAVDHHSSATAHLSSATRVSTAAPNKSSTSTPNSSTTTSSKTNPSKTRSSHSSHRHSKTKSSHHATPSKTTFHKTTRSSFYPQPTSTRTIKGTTTLTSKVILSRPKPPATTTVYVTTTKSKGWRFTPRPTTFTKTVTAFPSQSCSEDCCGSASTCDSNCPACRKPSSATHARREIDAETRLPSLAKSAIPCCEQDPFCCSEIPQGKCDLCNCPTCETIGHVYYVGTSTYIPRRQATPAYGPPDKTYNSRNPGPTSYKFVAAGTSITYKTTTVYDSVSTRTISTDTTRTITVVASATPQTVTITASGCRKQVEELVRVTLMPDTRPTDITLTRKAYMSYCPFQEAQDRGECYTYWSTIWS